MNTPKRKIMIATIGTVATAFIIAAFFNGYIISAVFSAERIGFYEISAIRAARTNDVASMILIRNNTEMQFPLPNGAIEFENEIYPTRDGTKQFLVTTEAFWHYIDVLLPQNEFEHDQLGSGHIVTGRNMRIDIITSMFTQNFMRITVINVEGN